MIPPTRRDGTEISVNQKNDLNRRILNCMVTDDHIGEGEILIGSLNVKTTIIRAAFFEDPQECQQF